MKSLFPLTVDEAREELFEKAAESKGANCPCCGRFTKIYKFNFNATLSKVLIWLYGYHCKNGFGNYVYIPTQAPAYIVKSRGSLSWAGRWDLCELDRPTKKERKEGKTRTSGRWRITPTGVSFVKMEIRVPKYVHMYNNQRQGFSGREVGIKEFFADPKDYFHYREMMMGEGSRLPNGTP